MHQWKGDKKFGQGPPPPPLIWTKSKRTAAFFRENVPEALFIFVIALHGQKTVESFKCQFVLWSNDWGCTSIRNIFKVNLQTTLIKSIIPSLLPIMLVHGRLSIAQDDRQRSILSLTLCVFVTKRDKPGSFVVFHILNECCYNFTAGSQNVYQDLLFHHSVCKVTPVHILLDLVHLHLAYLTIFMRIFERTKKTSGISLKRSCKMLFRCADPVSIGPQSQKLLPNLIFAQFPHRN